MSDPSRPPVICSDEDRAPPVVDVDRIEHALPIPPRTTRTMVVGKPFLERVLRGGLAPITATNVPRDLEIEGVIEVRDLPLDDRPEERGPGDLIVRVSSATWPADAPPVFVPTYETAVVRFTTTPPDDRFPL
ncbi:MAG: hypothetical protein V3S03_08485 [Vicinamibacteria bacterium]